MTWGVGVSVPSIYRESPLRPRLSILSPTGLRIIRPLKYSKYSEILKYIYKSFRA